MSSQQQRESYGIGQDINEFEKLYPRQVDATDWRVLSTRNGSTTAHIVDIEELECTCKDGQFNKQDPEVCDHIASALYYADTKLDVNDYATAHLTSLVDRAQAAVSEIENIRDVEGAVRDANAQAAAETAETDDTQGFDGDPVEYFESLLRDEGLDPDNFDVWVHDDMGSLQVEVTGYLDDDSFDDWVDMSNDLDMGYDGDSDVNYLQSDRFTEVFGS